ncbi:hypothetical protein AQUCO_01300757v1 [Aquilegia coerulea]|uniref:Protein kinase domain-containing protein n=1 Tax=Aquilegia coerulea TaxID=218851 RepID=A0A2G5E3A9_AQUCA|nr:hypothetical protein AQUCO_01300757v1 [Aquilegia coerulea]
MGLQILCFAILFLCVVYPEAALEPSQNQSHCESQCGDQSVPYPFGLENNSHECFINSSYKLSCNHSFTPPILFFSNIPILNISIENATAIVHVNTAITCYNESGVESEFNQFMNLADSPFTISSALNTFMAIGCDTLALLSYEDNELGTGCFSTCNNSTLIGDPTQITEVVEPCSNFGCCQTKIPKGLKYLEIYLSSMSNHSDILGSNPCDYAFLTAGPNADLVNGPENTVSSQVVLDWAVGDTTCEEAKHICGLNTNCINSYNSSGYRCSCMQGYAGNPFTVEGCEASGIAILLTAFVLPLGWIYKRKIQENNQRRNGGLLLKHLSVKIFKEAQLEKATDKFDARKLLGEGGNGWVYKGIADNTEIAVKKSKVIDQDQIEQFLNEVDIVSKINHKNVVKLLGVCLETKVPMLVYEFVPNGTLFHHIHGNNQRILYSWSRCLRIAAETARALEYMHSSAHPPIIHRDIKTANILLDGTYTAKVADFGASKLIPMGQTIGPDTRGQGTMGYLDPEYLQTGELTVKSDVYGFGVVLMELLSKQKPLFKVESGEMVSIVKVFTSAVEDNQLDRVLKIGVANEDEMEQVHVVAELAVKCVEMPSKHRPTMTEVADILAGLTKEYQNLQIEEGSEELVGLLDAQEIVTTSVHFELEYSGSI